MMASKAYIGGVPSVVSVAGVEILAGGPYPDDMPPENLATDEPGEVARILSVDPAETFWTFSLAAQEGGANDWPLDFFALVNHNLTAAATFKVAGKLYASLGDALQFERLYPTAISGSGVSGTVTRLTDSPFAPDDSEVTVSGVSSYLHATMADPSAGLFAGTGGAQAFYLRAKASTAGYTVTVQLYSAGAFVSTLGTFTAPADYEVFGFVVPGTIASPNDVEVRILWGQAAATLFVDSLVWVAEVDNYGHDFDSGWLPVPSAVADSQFGGTSAADVALEPQRSLEVLIPGGLSLQRLAVAIRDPNNPDGFVQAGVAVAGPAFRTEYAPALGEFVGIDDLSTGGETIGGSDFGSAGRRRRVLPVRFGALTREELLGLLERVDWRKGSRGAVWVSLCPEETDASARLAAAWCNVGPLERPQASPIPGRFSKSYTFPEKL